MKQAPLFAVVSKEESQLVPYPFVHVNDDGTVRELHPNERHYLETPFHPFDGERPYIKQSFDAKDGWGKLGGFCSRSSIPQAGDIQEAPLEDPSKPLTKERLMEFLHKKGLLVTENVDGAATARKTPKV